MVLSDYGPGLGQKTCNNNSNIGLILLVSKKKNNHVTNESTKYHFSAKY